MKKHSLTIVSLAALAVVAPFVAFAETKTLRTLIYEIINYLNLFLVLMIGFAIVMFVYNVIKYFIMADADRTEAAKYVMYSVIGFFVILSFWGLVNILMGTFGLNNETYRPSSWTSFTNLFPGGGSSDGKTFNNSGQQFPFNIKDGVDYDPKRFDPSQVTS